MILCRYIRDLTAKSGFIISAAFVILLLSLEWLLQFSSLSGDYGSLQALAYSAYLLPRNLYASAPILVVCIVHALYLYMQGKGTWLGCLVTGYTPRRLGMWVLSVVAGWVFVWMVMGEGLAPTMTARAKQVKVMWTHHQALFVGSKGLWLSAKEGMVYLGRINGQEIGHALWYHPEKDAMRVYVADHITFGHRRWQAARSRVLLLGDDEAKETEVKDQVWPVHLSPKALRMSMRAPEERPWLVLWQHGKDQESRYLCWQRFFYPFWLVILALLLLVRLPKHGEALSLLHWVWAVGWVLLMLFFSQIHSMFLPYLSGFLVALCPILLYSLCMITILLKEWVYDR